jgi:4-amino-4-deoxy-L-arabinose transferase-like glycosyltransferase
MLPLLVYLVFRVVKNEKISFWFALFLGLNPILIGISQILNPDAILWSSATIALLSFIIFLQDKDGQRKFIWLAGIFTGMALLSKYTGNLLFLFYLLFGVVYFLYSKKMETNSYWRKFLQGYLGVTVITWIVFALFLPAVLQSPDLLSWSKPKHFAYGTYFSPALKPILKPLLVLLAVLLVDTFYFKSYLMKYLKRIFYKYRFWFIRLTGFVLVVFFSFILINAWSGAKFLPLDDLKEVVGSSKKLHFDFLANDFVAVSYFKQLSLEGLNFVFALPELTVFLLIPFWFLMLLKPEKILYPALSVFISWLPFIFFIGGLKAKVFVNVRYAIILFPFFILLTSLALVNFWQYFKVRERLGRKALRIGGLAVMIMIGWQIGGILNIRPYYFNYQNIFLPKEYVLTDSWGYGMFEAAMKLNSLPGAEDLVVWSDRGAFCYYFVGHCVKNRRMDRSKIVPDFFVVTRRNVARKRFFDWRNDSGKFAKHLPEYYYQGDVFEKPWWELEIDGRKKNYIKIIKAEEK